MPCAVPACVLFSAADRAQCPGQSTATKAHLSATTFSVCTVLSSRPQIQDGRPSERERVLARAWASAVEAANAAAATAEKRVATANACVAAAEARAIAAERTLESFVAAKAAAAADSQLARALMSYPARRPSGEVRLVVPAMRGYPWSLL